MRRLSADRQPGRAEAAAEDLHGPVFPHGVVGGVKGEGGLEQGERRQFVHVGPLEETAEEIGGLFDAAAVEFGDAQAGEGFGAGVREEVTAHHGLEQRRVGAGLAEGRQGRPAELDPVGCQPLLGERGDEVLGLGAGAGPEDREISLGVLDLGFEERIFRLVEDALEELRGVVPVLGGDIFVGGLDLVGGLAVGGQQHGVGTGAGRRGGGEDLCGADGREGQPGQDDASGGDKRKRGRPVIGWRPPGETFPSVRTVGHGV